MTTPSIDTSETLIYGARSDIGKRPNQEDRWEIKPFQTADGRPALLALVADGIGGHNTGEIASQLAKESVPARLLAQPPSASEITRRLKAALEETGRAIYDASLADDSRAGMGTTCTAIVVADRRLYLAHVGDSRAYLLRGGGLRQLTVDHTWAEEAIRAGRAPEEIRNHPNRGVIMRYLGIDPIVSVDTRYRIDDAETGDALNAPLFLEPGDTLMLCSDGVSDALDSRTIVSFLQQRDLQVAAEALVSNATKTGATDNVTALALRVPGGAPVRGKRPPVLPIILAGVALVAVAAIPAVLLMSGGRQPAASATPVAQTAAASALVDTAAPAGPTPTGGGLVMVTAAPGAPGSQASTEPAGVASAEVSGTGAAPTGQAGGPTLAPTRTVEPTRTPEPARPSGATPPAPASSPAAGTDIPTGGVLLISPPAGEMIRGSATFAWSDAPGFFLRAGEQYELIIWGQGQDPLRDGRSPTGATDQTTVSANLTGVESALGLTPGQTYSWGVRLRKASGPVRMLSDGRAFTYERADAGGGGQPTPACTGTGPDCAK